MILWLFVAAVLLAFLLATTRRRHGAPTVSRRYGVRYSDGDGGYRIDRYVDRDGLGAHGVYGRYLESHEDVGIWNDGERRLSSPVHGADNSRRQQLNRRCRSRNVR